MALQDPLVAVLQFHLSATMTTRKASGGDGLSGLLGYTFKDPVLLEQALTHGSLPKASINYERLEFLGDRVLGLVIAEALYRQHGREKEGKLAARHSTLVRGDACADVAERLGLADIVKVGAAEKKLGVNKTRSILGDVVEAIIGAIYMDGGFKAAQKFILSNWADVLSKPETAQKDAKTFVQEWVLARGTSLPSYEVIERTGPEHMPEFRVRLTVGAHGQAEGIGRSKQVAEMAAAQRFIEASGLRK
jgi:ribonuclease III